MPKMSEFTELDETTFDGSTDYMTGYQSDNLTATSNYRILGDDFLLWVKSEMVYSTPIPVLTGAFGTTGSAIADVTTAFDQSILNNNFRALEDKVNAIHAALLNAGLITTS